MMIQKHWEFGELESFAHIVHKGEDLLKKKENSKIGRGKTIQNMLTFKVRIHVFAAKENVLFV